MRTDLDILKELVKQEIQVNITSNYNKYFVELDEPLCKEYKVRIDKLPRNSLVIKIDSFPPAAKFFNNSKHECKRADYIIISENDRKKVILFIEMKKGRGENNEIIAQLYGAQCVIKYCIEIGRCFWKKKDFLDGFNFRFISVRKIGLQKRPIIRREEKINDTPENMLKIYAPNYLMFDKLVGS